MMFSTGRFVGSMSLTWRLRFSYAIGHGLNDLCASVWFTYTLVFFKFGIHLPHFLAGTIVLIGQMVDGFSTPLVGFFSDRSSAQHLSQPSVFNNEKSDVASIADEVSSSNLHTQLNEGLPLTPTSTTLLVTRQRRCRCWWPRGRKGWHLAGSLCVIFSFPLLFGPPNSSKNVSTWAKMIYYAPLVTIFQMGWAAVQITHLALMNELTVDPGERTLLVSLRYLFTVLSNLGVYVSTFLLLHRSNPPANATLSVHPNYSSNIYSSQYVASKHPILSSVHLSSTPINDSSDSIDFDISDVFAFQKLALLIIGVGGLMSLAFHLGVRNVDILGFLPPNRHNSAPSSTSTSQCRAGRVINSWKDWLKYPLFWILGLTYMSIRLIVNVSQAYVTVYLLDTLHLSKSSMALVPLTIYATSIGTLLLQKPIQDIISRELNTTLGLIFVTIFCVLINYPGEPTIIYRVYIAAGLLGIGCTTILITSLAMVSDLIGENQNNGAFVYGYMSFLDKLANGIVIQLIESLCSHFPNQRYYQYVETYVIGAFVASLSLLLFIQTLIKRLNYGPTVFVIDANTGYNH